MTIGSWFSRLNKVPAHVPLYRLVSEEEKRSVGGLLLLFCVTRTIIAPVYLAIKYGMIFSHHVGLVRVFTLAPWLFVLLGGDVLLVTFGIWAGILIWKLRTFGIRLAKWYLVLTLVYPLVFGLLLQKGPLAVQMGYSFGLSLIPSTLWFIYLCTSERVRNICERDQARE